MPNICTTNYVIEGEKKELDALYQTLKELQEMEQSAVENDFGPTWLGCLVKALGKNAEEVECRGVWTDLEHQDDTLRVTFETAWTPCYEVTTLLKEAYPSLRIFYKAEEPGCDVYLKNDAEGKYFPETETDGSLVLSDSLMKLSDIRAIRQEIDEGREALLRYCELDTWAMVKVWEKLKEVAV